MVFRVLKVYMWGANASVLDHYLGTSAAQLCSYVHQSWAATENKSRKTKQTRDGRRNLAFMQSKEG